MPQFTLEYTVTERTRQRMTVEADTADEAIRLLAEYEIDETDNWQTDSLEYSIGDVDLVDVETDKPVPRYVKRFVIVEQSGYEGERDTSAHADLMAAITHRAKTYDADELDPESPNCLHVGIRMDWTDEAGEHQEYVA
jgi:hypothetical protein